MKKRRFFFACILFLLAGGLAWQLRYGLPDFGQARKAVGNSVQNAVLGAVQPEDVAALAMKTLEMKQGEHGIELWRLKAAWGNVRQEGGMLELATPRFTYYMPPNNEELQVVSERGEVDQSAKIIRFVRSVVATYGNSTLKAPLMVYNGTAKTLIFPQGTDFAGPDMEGTARDAVWRLNDRVIDASGGVDITWERAVDLLAAPRAARYNAGPSRNETAPVSSPDASQGTPHAR
jgi:hypothetical protein